MTKEQMIEMVGLERDIAQLERALSNPSLVASQKDSPQQKMALERLAEKRMRVAELSAHE